MGGGANAKKLSKLNQDRKIGVQYIILYIIYTNININQPRP